MADEDEVLARRRELRKKKILENAELRKQKLLNLNSKFVDTTVTENLNITSTNSKDQNSTQQSLEDEFSEPSSESDLSSYMKKINDVLKNIPDPMLSMENETPNCPPILRNNEAENISDHTSHTSTHNTSNMSHSFINNDELNNFNKFTPSPKPTSLYTLDHPAAPVFLAIVVSLLLYINMGYVISNSLIIPFCLWEMQKWIASLMTHNVNEENSSILEGAFKLCGVNKSIVKNALEALMFLKSILQDFSVYLFTVIIWHLFIGYPTVGVS